MKFKTLIQLYNYIWDTRDHVSELSGNPLLHNKHPQWRWQFAHILPHGSYPAFKFLPENICLMTVKEHEDQESNPKFKEKYAEMKRRYYKEIYGKEFN